jgi:alpha-mannosidase/mannosylglycerate hydrolase
MAKAEKPKTYSAHYVSGTHWDREWYRPVQEYRLLLVEVIDELLDLMEKQDDFKYFHLDGQTCVLRDYTEVRPENEERLAEMIRQGRILIGPWYTMPDLFCPGDEALIRNLLLGQRLCREWGVEPMPVAYTCDMFGHPSQMPQIYRGFDMPHCVLGRGTNEHTTPAFFTWKAPDGSSVFVFKLQDNMGYGAFVGSRWAIERATSEKSEEAEKKARESLASYVGHEIGRTNGGVLCLIDALDHMRPATDAARYLRILHEACPSVRGRHSNLPAFFAEAEKSAKNLPVRTGELREPSKTRNGYLWLIPNCVSARVRMKQANDECLMLLERWAEPFLAAANVEGAALPERCLRIAWEHVLLNHAHDSICGCSIDQVVKDMMYRFDQARILADQLRSKAFGALTKGCADLAKAEHEFTLTVANPLPRRRKEVVVFHIDLPFDYPTFFHEGFRGAQDIKSFTLHDLDGTEVPYQRLAIDPKTNERSRYALPAHCGEGEFARYTVAAELDLPALGFTSLLVRPCPMAVRRVGTLRTGPTAAENESLAIAIAPNGTLTLIDKAHGEAYTDLLTFEDRSELGDGWFHADTVTDEIALSTGSAAQISVVHEGPEMVAFRVAVTMSVPARYDRQTERRSKERVDLAIVSFVSLRRGAKVVEVETVVENTAEDHRLRLLLPSDVAEAKTYLAHHPFDLVERKIAIDPETATWQEMELAEKPFLGLQAVGAGRRGLAFLSAGGLHEGGVTDDERRTLLVTLLRSFRRTVGTPGEPDGLERGTLTYRYALIPFPGELPRAEALWEMIRLQAGVLTRQTGRFPSGYPAMAGKAEPRLSLIEQKTGRLIVSAIKPAEAGGSLVIRLWNPTGKVQRETLTFWRWVRRATLLKLSEEPAGGKKLVVKGKAVTVQAGPHQVVTLRADLA